MLVHYAKLDSVVVTEEEVDRQLNARIEQILTVMNNDVNQFESYYDMTVSEAKTMFREDLERQLLAERKREEVLQSISVTPSDVKDFFDQIPRDSLPLFNAEVELGEIIHKPEVNAEERKKALNQINLVMEKLKAGEDFAELANTYSDDPGNRGRFGGDLGWVSRGTFVPEFEAAAFKLGEGEFSDIVETDFGFHIIQLLERKGLTVHLRHILIRPEITQADLDKAVAHLKNIKEQVESDSLTFTEAVREYSDEDAQSYSNAGRMVNTKTGNTFFETADLDPDIFFAIDTIAVGDITTPIAFKSQTGDVIYKIFQLQSRTSPHRANLSQDYSKIRSAARESKRNESFSAWLKNKIRETYIEIDPAYYDCESVQKWLKEGSASQVGD
jgi:peptidyl-prolyl cis-trans isomerase SurA